ncbi:thiol reductant ABC exporter subunit CydD [Streptomyces iconiensis]|uniref:Thiol reductant ABC exporter subunit CydD n=1 Tax=Streptomyces iconiensis TaxID=1384038 RepID=A0ABT6ZS84_9ACTN|nr:thiol reductant ABC exporter subunit CydD [Streptomyces iconiensis]MDJ1131727.1 thiol reductant ABC exporter subunit CydD [Streptomyces iconiensis]
MKPVDPRLLRYARTTRVFLVAAVALGLAGAALVVGQAMLIADIVVSAYQHEEFARTSLLLLAGVTVARALVSWLTELAAHRCGAAVKSELRTRLLGHATALGPGFLTTQRTGELATLATRGIDALDDYFARYLPQLGLAVVVPVAVLARIVTADWISAAIIAGTLPLIPLFMALIGWATQSRMDRQWRLLGRLSGHFLDVVAGLPTLKVFGRAKAQADNIRTITADYRRATLRTLRIAFLSSFALELLATISVAIVAVSIGIRLVNGDFDLYTGLMVLILAPEAYLPLRQVGTHYHAAAEGLSAAEEVFTVLETAPRAPHGTAPAPSVRTATLSFEGVVVRHEGRTGPSLAATDLTVAPGETVALTGPSGGGKTTLLSVLLGFTAPSGGRVLVGDVPLDSLELSGWHEQIAWVPQHPYLFAGTVADNVRLARPAADDDAVARALAEVAASDLDPGLVLGEAGAGLSAGQRQRVALARAFLADRPLLLLDEPTAALDGATEGTVADAVRRLAAGRTVLLVTHRPALLGAADRVLSLSPASPPASPPAASVPAAGPPASRGEAQPLAGGGEQAQEAHAAGQAQVPEQGPVQPQLGERGAEAAHGRVAAPGVGPLARVRGMAGPLRGRFGLALALGALALAGAVGLMATSGWLISRAAQQPPILYLMVAVTATRAFGIGRAVFRYAERLVSHDAALRVLADLRVSVYTRLERLAPAGLRRTRRGDLLTRLVADVDALQDYFLRWLLPATVAGTVGVLAVGFTAWLLPAAGAALAVGLVVAGVCVPALTGALSRRTERRLAPARAELATRTVDLLTGTATGELPVTGALAARSREVAAADAELTRIAAGSAARTALASGLSTLAAGLTVVVAAWAGALATTGGALNGLLLATVVLTPLAAFEAVTPLPLAVQYRQRVRRSAERVYEVLDAPAPIREPVRPRALAETFPLRTKGLSVRYPDAPEGAPAALDGFDLELTPGRRVAVVGPSGSGKTTLANALLRFLDPADGPRPADPADPGARPDTEGSTDPADTADPADLAGPASAYTLGGVPAVEAEGDAVRRHVGLCAQDAHLFDSTLRENLRLARPSADEADLWAALAAARLDTWVDTLPDGLDTHVGEHGAKLSGGQRQRLALARALLADFPVLVLDEPAEHLDLPTADALTADLLAVTEGRTTVLITHRLQGLDAVDEVIVLDGGRVAERGPYAELAVSGGPFAAMLTREREATDSALAATGSVLAAQPVG